MSSHQETAARNTKSVTAGDYIRRALRNRDVRGIIVLLVGLVVVTFMWDNGGARSLATIIDTLAAATPEQRAVALNYLGQAAFIFFFGIAIAGRALTAFNRRRAARTSPTSLL